MKVTESKKLKRNVYDVVDQNKPLADLLVTNPFDRSIRNNNTIAFTDFSKEGAEINTYRPAQLQRQVNSEPKQHVIHKKMKGQSTVAVRREAGVSYVKETESRQLFVSDRYERLGHTVF